MADHKASPAMVYQPPASPDLGYGIDDEDNERRWSVRAGLITMLRIPVTVLAFSDIIAWICLDLPTGPVVGVFVMLFLVVAWNLALVLPRSRFTRALPAVVCQVGDCVWRLNGDGGRDGRPRKPISRKQKRARLILIALVDLALGLLITILLGARWHHLPYWYRQQHNRGALLPLTIITGVMELILAILSLVACYWTVDFELGAILWNIDDPESQARIRLAPDTGDRQTAGGTVSVAA
jgi:hypothetical protein